MSCFIEEEAGQRTAVFIFRRDMLLYDIENYAYIEGSVMNTETPPHNRHMVQDVGEEGNINRVDRVLDMCHAQVKEALYPYTKHEIHNEQLNNKLRQPKVYGIILSVPEGYSQTTLNFLEKLIHEYLVCRAVEDWMSITNPAKQETWRIKAEEALGEIRTTMNTRMKRTRIKPHFL